MVYGDLCQRITQELQEQAEQPTGKVSALSPKLSPDTVEAMLAHCLREPRQVTVRSPDTPTETFEAWLVFEEAPYAAEGYKIVFETDSQLFGLTVTEQESDRLCLVGYYGSFLDTLGSI
ncbi:MAG: hypothetical protein ACO34J_15475 [Prochlorothrix sp.]